jgi:hypothetical protein
LIPLSAVYKAGVADFMNTLQIRYAARTDVSTTTTTATAIIVVSAALIIIIIIVIIIIGSLLF